MSGPKRGSWRFVYDPTPTRLADLSGFVAKQDAWLKQNGSFIQSYLGNEALITAQAARDLVQKYIAAGDPDAGFDAYGEAWSLFNQLYRQAMETKQRLRLQEQLRQQQAAANILDEYKETWQAPENQTLLLRWVAASEHQRLAADLRSVSTGSFEQVQRKAQAWQRNFKQAIETATNRAAENSRVVKACIPALRTIIQTIGILNTTVLPDEDQKQFNALKTQLHQDAESALSKEDLNALQLQIGHLENLAAEYAPKIKAAQLRKASQIWRDALAKCGYAVSSRTEPGGAIILEATSFPLRSLNVQVSPDTDEVKLEVNGKHDHTCCVKDVQSLQAELARHGVELNMTDWGKGKPGIIEQQLSSKLSIGGVL